MGPAHHTIENTHYWISYLLTVSKNWKILATEYRRPLRKLATYLAAVAALEFYPLNWTSSV